ncbi:flagellar basal body P-ring formation chaperone FlgA [soil metagenome]
MRRVATILVSTAALLLAAAPALAGPVTLKINPVDDDGRVTLGEVFDGAGSAAGTVIASRAGPSVVFDAGQLQALALRSGLQWSNPRGLGRVVVREGMPAPTAASVVSATTTFAAAQPGATVEVLAYARNLAAGDIVQPEDVIWSTVQAHQAPSGGPRDAEQVIGLSAKRALRAGAAVASRDLASPQVIARNDMVEVAFISGGVRLTITGRATRNAALGEPVSVMNTTSNRTVEAIATGPGKAVVGPAADLARANPQQFASR